MDSTILTLQNSGLSFSMNDYGTASSSGPTVLCLHGFPDNANSYRKQIDDFVTAGYRVLVPTMRGYEPSSIPSDNNFVVEAMISDVLAWLDELELTQVHLVGHDWGSVIAQSTAAQAPERFLSLTAIAVPQPRRFLQIGMVKVPSQLIKSWYMMFSQLPGISDYLYRRNDFALIRYLWRKWAPGLELSDAEWQDLSQTFSAPGVLKATLSYYRQNMSLPILLHIKPGVANNLGAIAVDTLAITGANDGCVDTRVYDYSFLEEDFPKGIRMERITGAGHFVHQEVPNIINPMLTSWFKQHDL